MLLIIISVLPVIVIMGYMYYRDKYEKEPILVLLKAFFGGILSIVCTLLLLIPLEPYLPVSENIVTNALLSAFLRAAIPEEFFKFIFLYWFIWNNRHFNENYDGILYAVFVSLGFACVENIAYVWSGGIGIGIMRAFFSVPGHALFGVIMGYYFSLAKFGAENKKMLLLKGLFLAILAHGIFNFLLLLASGISHIHPILSSLLIFAFGYFVFRLYKIGFMKIHKHVESSVFKINT